MSVQDSSASAALQTFTGGKGDVLLDYESDAIAAEKAGDSIQYMIPKQTILIQTPIAVTAKSSHAAAGPGVRPLAVVDGGPDDLGPAGLPAGRPGGRSRPTRARFPTPPELFKIKFLGGWSMVKKSFFDPSSGSITKIEQAAGVPTATS